MKVTIRIDDSVGEVMTFMTSVERFDARGWEIFHKEFECVVRRYFSTQKQQERRIKADEHRLAYK